VYSGGAGWGGTVYAVDASTAAVEWTASVANGDNSSRRCRHAACTYACGQAYGFSPRSGALLWHRVAGCSGGGGTTPVLAGGRLYVRDFSFPAVLDAASGSELGPFLTSGPAPAVDASNRYELTGSTLRAVDISSGVTRWSFSGDGALSSAPIVADDTVIIGSASGFIYGLSAATGAVVWSGSAGSAIPAPDEQNVRQPLTGLATSAGLIVVPAGQLLVGLRRGDRPPPDRGQQREPRRTSGASGDGQRRGV
jgi:outer membrane protein assembly factor BamB